MSAASNEQSSGVAQINQAMSLLDQITQQNASAAEELSATAEELAGQAQTLRQRMEIFTLANGRMQVEQGEVVAYPDLADLGRPARAASNRTWVPELAQLDFERF